MQAALFYPSTVLFFLTGLIRPLLFIFRVHRLLDPSHYSGSNLISGSFNRDSIDHEERETLAGVPKAGDHTDLECGECKAALGFAEAGIALSQQPGAAIAISSYA